MKATFSERRPPVWQCLLFFLCCSSLVSSHAASLYDFGYRHLATNNEVGPSRPMLVIMANFPPPSPTFANSTNVAYYSNRVFEVNPSKYTVNGYFKEMSNDRFQWAPAGVLLVQMPEAARREHMSSDSAYASNIIYRAVSVSGFNWDVYHDASKGAKVTDRELAITLISNDQMLSARGVGGIKPPGVTNAYEGLVYVGKHLDNLDVMCHEMSHILGAVDFYGIWGTGECLANRLALMSCSGGGFYHHDAWHKLQFGWSRPRIFPLNQSGTAILNAAQEGLLNAPVILYDTNRGPDEFFLLEYRTRSVTGAGGGYDFNVAGDGLVIWHVAHNANQMPALMADISWPNAERTWRECTKCRSLTYGTSAPGTCAAGGVHAPFQDDHGLAKDDPSSAGQPGWKRCSKCKSLFFGPNQAASNCPAGGTHNAEAGDYRLITDSTVLAHHYWRRCTKCETLYLSWLYPQGAITTNGVCVVGGAHLADTNIEYTLPAFWAIKALQPEAHPDLRRGESEVWPGGSRTPWLTWYDQTPACVNVEVRPFATGTNSITIDWTNESGTWVDFYYSGTEMGTFPQPYNQLSEGVSAVAPGGYLHIKSSRSALPARITKSMRVRAYGGNAIIGR